MDVAASGRPQEPVSTVTSRADCTWQSSPTMGGREANRRNKRRFRPPQPPSREGITAGAYLHAGRVVSVGLVSVGGKAWRVAAADRVNERRLRLPQPPSGEGIVARVRLHVGRRVAVAVVRVRGNAGGGGGGLTG